MIRKNIQTPEGHEYGVEDRPRIVQHCRHLDEEALVREVPGAATITVRTHLERLAGRTSLSSVQFY